MPNRRTLAETTYSEIPSKTVMSSHTRDNEMSVHTCATIRRLLTEKYAGYGGQARLAEALDVTPARISKLAKEGGGVSVDFARRVATLAGVQPILVEKPTSSSGPTVPSMPRVVVSARKPKLDAAITYHEGPNGPKWSAATIAAARASEVEDMLPQAWAEVLDALEKAITGVLKKL